MKNLTLPTYEDVAAAAERIKGFANKTPVLTSRTVNNEFEAEVFFKCENFQRVGAFKFRGAMNALSQFDEAQKKAGVVAFSSGNHAQSIALSAKILGIPATIIMPKDAPAAKKALKVHQKKAHQMVTLLFADEQKKEWHDYKTWLLECFR